MAATYIFPSGDGKSTVTVDLERVAYATRRLPDEAIANATTAPELLHTFGAAWEWLEQQCTAVRAERSRCEDAIVTAKATALIAAEGAKSADIRGARVELDSAVQAARARLIEITAVRDYLQAARERFEKAWRGVRASFYGGQAPKGDVRGAPGGLGNAGGGGTVGDKNLEDEFDF